jgi:hypothetical protein
MVTVVPTGPLEGVSVKSLGNGDGGGTIDTGVGVGAVVVVVGGDMIVEEGVDVVMIGRLPGTDPVSRANKGFP